MPIQYPFKLLVSLAAAVLLPAPAHAQHGHGGWHGAQGTQPSEGWHGTPGLQPQGTPGLEWHGTPGLQGGQNWQGGQWQGWQGGHDWHGAQSWQHEPGRHDGAPHDGHAWRGGSWHHGAHQGHDGWWWVVGPTWYYYPSPVYPYPEPYVSPLYVPAPGPLQYWLWCPSYNAYYPYVDVCPGGWMQVPAQ